MKLMERKLDTHVQELFYLQTNYGCLSAPQSLTGESAWYFQMMKIFNIKFNSVNEENFHSLVFHLTLPKSVQSCG